jgi:thiol-disulfide isomerase/thioredoxin
MLFWALACTHTRPPAVGPGSPSALDHREGEEDSPRAPLVGLDEAGLGALLANPRQHLLVVNIWATWCGPCREELDLLRATALAHPEAEFVLLSVDSPRDRADVEDYLADRGLTLPAYLLETDEPSAVLARQVDGWPDLIPVTLVLEPGGGVRKRFDGILEGDALGEALR